MPRDQSGPTFDAAPGKTEVGQPKLDASATGETGRLDVPLGPDGPAPLDTRGSGETAKNDGASGDGGAPKSDGSSGDGVGGDGPSNGATLTLEALRFGPNAVAQVAFSKAPTSTSAWIGLYAASSDDGKYVSYQSTGAVESGTLSFTLPETPGTYDFRLFKDSGYNKVGTSAPLTVSLPYDLDPGFAGAGKFSLDFLGANLLDSICTVIPLADGKIVLAGMTDTGTKNTAGSQVNAFAVVRLSADGTLDATFGSGGKVSAAPTTHGTLTCTAAVLGKSGEIIMGGYGRGASSGLDYVLARFTSAGVLDATFGSAGWVVTNFRSSETSSGEHDKLLSLALLPDGRILAGGEMMYAAGSYNNGRPSLARYMPDGSLDTTFGGLGALTLDPSTMAVPGGQTVFDVNSLVVSSTGAFFAGITAISSYGRNDMAIAGLSATGSLDPAFGVAGLRWESKPGTHNEQYLAKILQTASGRLLMLGHDLFSWFLGGYTAAGAVDTGFGTAGQAVADFSEGYDYPAGVVPLQDGSFLVGVNPNSSDGVGMGGNLGLVHHDPQGNLDKVFGKLRWKWGTAGTSMGSRASSFAMQTDGKLLLAGVVETAWGGNRDFAVIRLVKQPGW